MSKKKNNNEHTEAVAKGKRTVPDLQKLMPSWVNMQNAKCKGNPDKVIPMEYQKNV